jgi:hypothetical protein
MIYLNNQQRNTLFAIVVIVLGILAVKLAGRQYQAMALDLKGLLDGYKHSSSAQSDKVDTAVLSSSSAPTRQICIKPENGNRKRNQIERNARVN